MQLLESNDVRATKLSSNTDKKSLGLVNYIGQPLFSVRCDHRLFLARDGLLELITQSTVVTSLQAALSPLPLSGFNQMLETPRPLHGGFATFCATAVPLHA